MALTGESKADTRAVAGCGRYGSMRAGYAPQDVDADERPMWTESFESGDRPASTTWTSVRE